MTTNAESSGAKLCSDAILSEAEINSHHAAIGANFGEESPITVVRKGLLKSACGWHNGSTCESILRHHKLIEGKHGEKIRLTRRGQLFLWESLKDAL